VDPYLAAAAKFQAVGKEKAVAILRAAANDPKVENEVVIVLCRLLFTAKPKGEFRRPMIGRPHCLGGTGPADWPLEPIEVVDRVPFLIATGYEMAGQAEPAGEYLDYCLKECAWGATEFKPRTAAEKQAALAGLLASKKWKQPLTEFERKFLADQIK